MANEGLWPLCHVAFHRPIFRLKDWESYRRANPLFADAVLQEAAGGPALVFIQDYHFELLPRILKDRNPSLIVAQFWHIPWPNREIFRAFPWKDESLDGLLGCLEAALLLDPLTPLQIVDGNVPALRRAKNENPEMLPRRVESAHRSLSTVRP